MQGWRKGRKEGRFLSIIKYLAVIKSVSSVASNNIQGKDSKGYQVETLPRRQWNLKSTQDQFWKLQCNIFFLLFFFCFFLFQVSYIKTPKQVDEFIEIQSSTGTWYQRWLVRITTTFKQVRKKHSTGAFELWALVPQCFRSLKHRVSLKNICWCLQRAVNSLHSLHSVHLQTARPPKVPLSITGVQLC